jgi:tetratricopeptide (TPR) repeat protein
MRFGKVISAFMLAPVFLGGFSTARGQSEILYDPEKGIQFVDKKDSAKQDGSLKSLLSPKQKGELVGAAADGPAPRLPVVNPRESTDLHVGRKKDPPTLYFMSGLEYFKNGDYTNALNNFRYADSVGKKTVYRLWVGKAWRQLEKPEKMLSIMREILLKQPASAIADDALFEMAAYYQSIDDYDSATQLYTKLSELYPFGESFSTGERFIEVAREQRKMVRAEMNNMLAILGYTNELLEENYRQFQKNQRLKETGTGDRVTVIAIKKMHQKLLDREAQNEKVKEQARRYLLWAWIAGAGGILIVFLSFWLMAQLLAQKKQLAELSKNIAELDSKTL